MTHPESDSLLCVPGVECSLALRMGTHHCWCAPRSTVSVASVASAADFPVAVLLVATGCQFLRHLTSTGRLLVQPAVLSQVRGRLRLFQICKYSIEYPNLSNNAPKSVGLVKFGRRRSLFSNVYKGDAHRCSQARGKALNLLQNNRVATERDE